MADAPRDPFFIDFQAAVAGRYSLERELGRGGMGIVYLAREVRLDRPVAIKTLPPHLGTHPPLRERFLREARTAARLSHPNIVPIHAVDEAGGFVFYAMAYVDGETLADRVERRGPLPAGSAARVLREVAWALAYAHDKGVIHRDVKPENILLEQGTGRALVADFGIARLAEASGGTGVGEVLGTPAFMSPEQACGDEVDRRSDLYSLGVVGYYMLCGKVPFTAATAAALMAKQVTVPAPALATVLPDAPSGLCQVIDRCLAKSPAERFATGEELAEAIRSALDARPETPVPVRAFLRSAGRHFVTLAAAAVALVPLVRGFTKGFLEGVGTSSVVTAALSLAFFGTIAGGAVVAALLAPGRRLVRSGFNWVDVRDGAQAEVIRRQEELAFEDASAPSTLDLWVRPFAWIAVLLGTTGVIYEIVHPPEHALLETLYAGALLLAGLSSVLRGRRRGLAKIPAALWSGPLGRWYISLSGLGIKDRTEGSAHHLTELTVGLAADDLFTSLPPEDRRALSDVPELVGRLLSRAQDARDQITALDRQIAEAGRGADGVAAAAGRAAAERVLIAVTAALENVRLGLLRLRAGSLTREGISRDLDAARRIADRIEPLLRQHDLERPRTMVP